MTNHITANLSAGILSTLGSFALAILVLLFMITVHEFGHYAVSKIFKFKVNEFAIGMGPAIFKKTKKNGEIFSLRAIPLGGFCAFAGEDADDTDPQAFNNKKPWQRLLVLIAGASMNFIAACIIFCISIGCYGQMTPQVFEVKTNLPAPAEYTLQAEDILISVNGKDIYLTTDIINALEGKKKGDTVECEILRNGKVQTKQIQLVADPTSKSMQDTSAVYDSLGIATIIGVGESTNIGTEILLKGDAILRITDTLPTSYEQNGEGLIDCVFIENGKKVTKYINEAEYMAQYRPYTKEMFISRLKQFSAGEDVYFYISRYYEDTQTSERILIKYTLENRFTDEKQTDDGILKYFNVTLSAPSYRMYSQNVKYGFFESIGRGFVYAFKNVTTNLSAFWQLLTGKLGIDTLGGPITTITMTSQVASLGFNYLLEMAGFIGVSLAVFNLLPIPALDGARAVFVIIEWIRKKPINRNVEGMIHTIGLMLLLVFAIGIDLIKCV